MRQLLFQSVNDNAYVCPLEFHDYCLLAEHGDAARIIIERYALPSYWKSNKKSQEYEDQTIGVARYLVGQPFPDAYRDLVIKWLARNLGADEERMQADPHLPF